ncbi:mitotic spindle assembly checkpoint protein MAD1 isoform X2 [Salmo salar]|uniref:Mitotic spindle assembly checkpoint protein MAD1 isoform X1 n=1 Tax=Salmo salar TaxID=8030 RepID=A0ABM3CJ88_SALSA|nr:mitotic spindle assembly checkpoint protein MAD1 isoform X1 [Salmo salar]XP_045546616.1 mitotic spindle assembly checkpoint protein MAD1 isoform X1 [Salmo salar]XP_045546617.1 mitotic spindle assembly checkpoint protein MAD1 isoform X2 [Salmo salar]
MDIEDDTTVFATLKSLKSFISLPDTSRNQGEPAPVQSDVLQKQYLQRLQLLEAAEKVQSKTQLIQMDQEKRQMEISHKRARIELEKNATLSARDFEREVDRNQDLLGRIRRLEEREAESSQSLSEKVEANRALRRTVESLNRRVEERDGWLNTSNQMVSGLKDEIRDLKQQIQTRDNTISKQTLENQGLQEHVELQHRKYQEVSQRCQALQSASSSCSDHELKIKELERKLALQEQDVVIVKNMRSEVARVPDMDKELRQLREENVYLRETRENVILLKEETEGLRRKVERMEKMKEEMVNVELEKEKLSQKLQAWENLGQSTGLNIRTPEDLSREVIQIQQREITVKQHNYTLTSSCRSVERSKADLQGELLSLRSKALEEQKKRETQESLVRRLQKRVLLLTKERDGMRAILESYDSELSSSDYTPQLSRRLREAEDILTKTQNHNTEMEVLLTKAQEEAGALKQQVQTMELELDVMKKQQDSVAEGNPLATNEEVNTLRLNIEELEGERQRLEEQNNVLELRLERHNLQGDYNPVKTKVLHFSLNPTSMAKQQRVEEVEALRAEVECLREHLRSLQTGGAITLAAAAGETSLSLPPSQEVLDLRKQMESAELKNQRLKEVFQRKIQEFRTVCYVLTGYQIDITTENQYRLTSVYAEHMDDSLLFKASGGVVGSGGSMQLMETDFSKTLREMVDLHLHHQKSIPAFLSAVTLDLFSRQTTV